MDISGKATAVFRRFPAVKLAYLFGSQASGNVGPMSDHDFAVYLDGVAAHEMTDIHLRPICELQKALDADAIDLVVLNTT